MGRPRIMLDVGYFQNKKIAALAWRRQLGWIYLLMEAKQQDREGVFASTPVLKIAAGVFRDGIAEWRQTGLLHDSEDLCDRCRGAFPDLEDGAVVVHDWPQYQVSRTTSWRIDKALDETSGETTVKQPGNIGETVVEPPSRARVTRFYVPSSNDETTEGVQGEPFPNIDSEAQTFLEGMTGRLIRQAGDKNLAEYDRQIGDHGLKAVVAAYGRAAKGLPASPRPTARQLVWSARAILEPFIDPKKVDELDRSEDDEKRKRRQSEATWQRRIEAYRQGGIWDPAWGQPPVEVAS